MQEHLRNIRRRQFLIDAGKTAAFLAIGYGIGAAYENFIQPSQKDIQPQPLNKEQLLDSLLQSILDTTPFTNQRVRLENLYLSQVQADPSLKRINQGFWVTTEPFVRAELLDLRYYLRQNKTEGLSSIPPDKRVWASQNSRSHPETLGVCLDTYPKAKKIIQKLIEDKIVQRFINGVPQLIVADEVMINPGGMMMLINTEMGGVDYRGLTYGFSDIGQSLAINEINTGKKAPFPNGREDVKEACRIVSQITGLSFQPDKVPGSEWPDKPPGWPIPKSPEEKKEWDEIKGSGGALEGFMPENYVKLHNLIKNEADIALNVFDIEDVTIMAWVFLAINGYWRSHPEDIDAALENWNPDGIQIPKIHDAANKYFNAFMENGAYPY